MVEIQAANGGMVLIIDGCPLNKTFFKIERVFHDSIYYCLWLDEQSEFFYLYNARNGKYVNSNIFNEAHPFKKIGLFSEETKSFVAYRSNDVLSYILYEESDYVEGPFKYVGQESMGLRPVEYYNKKKKRIEWCFFNVGNRKKSSPILLFENERLGKRFNDNFFAICYDDNSYKLAKTERNYLKRSYYCLDEIEDIENKYIIGRLKSRKIILLFKIGCLGPKGYYIDKPKYLEKEKLFVAHKENHWCIFDGNREIENYQWIDDNFIFSGNYIFNKSNSQTSWKVFIRKNGYELPLKWKNLKVSNDDSCSCILTVTENGSNQELTIADIDSEYQKFQKQYLENLEKSKHLNTKQEIVTEPINNIETENENKTVVDKDAKMSNEKDKDKDVVKEKMNQIKYNKLPKEIDYCISVNSVSINNDGYLIYRKKCKIQPIKHICWICKDEKVIVISELKHSNTHKVLYYKVLNEDTELFENQELKYFKPVQIVDISENTLVDKINEVIKVTEVTDKNVNDKDVITANKKVELVYNEKTYTLGIGDVWEVENPFRTRRFLKSKYKYLAILLDDTFNSINNPTDGIDYKMIGEGIDKKYDQDFSNNNAIIRDNSLPIYLFKRDEGVLRFFDQVKCLGYYERKQENRNIIIFQLHSLLKYNKNKVNTTEVAPTQEKSKKPELNSQKDLEIISLKHTLEQYNQAWDKFKSISEEIETMNAQLQEVRKEMKKLEDSLRIVNNKV